MAMKKVLQILAASVGVSMAAAAFGGSPASGIQSVRSGTAHDALFSIAFDRDAGLAVGGAGEVLRSADAGKTWQEVTPTRTSLALLGVDLSHGRGIAVGQSGLILMMAADGRWSKAQSGSTSRLLSVSINASGLAVAVGAFGTILKSPDGGQTWSSIAPDWSSFAPDGAQPHLYGVTVDDGGVITLCGEFGLILRSTDGGKSWRTLHKGDAALSAFDIRPDGVGYAVGQSATILRTADHGETWSELKVDSNANFLGVSSAANGQTVVTGMHYMLVSDDDGKSFHHVDDADIKTSWYQGIARSGPDTPGYAVGHAGQIIKIGG